MGVAAVHYMYMREFWVQIHSSPIVYRYIDWTITVPLQMVEFYLILSAVKPEIGVGMFWRFCSAPLPCWPSATWARLERSTLGQASPVAWLDGASSCSRSSWAKLALWPLEE